MMNRALFFCCLVVLSSCSAQIAIETEPLDQAVPVLSVGRPVFAEVALDLPEESVNTEELDIEIERIAARLVVFNPSATLTLRVAARLSFEGRATPGDPIVHTGINPPPYYDRAAVILRERDFAPGSRTPVTIDTPALKEAIGRRRVWIMVSNTVVNTGIGFPDTPLEIQLDDIIFEALITKPFPGLGGALEVGGL
jgi:hypothetical protein